MNRLAKFAWVVCIWLLVPFGLGCLGYYLIGPRIGQTGIVERYAPDLAKQKVAVAPAVKPASSLEVEPEPSKEYGEPEVEVTVTPIDRGSRRSTVRSTIGSSEKPKTTRRRKPKPKPKPVTESGRTDEGSVGGALPEGNTPPPP